MDQNSLASLLDRMERLDAKILYLESGKTPIFSIRNGNLKEAFRATASTREGLIEDLSQLGKVITGDSGDFSYVIERSTDQGTTKFQCSLEVEPDLLKARIIPLTPTPKSGSIVNNTITDLIDGMMAHEAYELMLQVGKYPVYKTHQGQECILDNYEILEYNEMMSDFRALEIKTLVSGLYKRYSHISDDDELSRVLVYHVDGIGQEMTVYFNEKYAL